MAVGTTVRILYNHIPRIAKQLQPAARAVARETLDEAYQTAQALVPVETGELQKSIGVEMEGDTGGVLYASAAHARFVELGTVNMAPQPYLIPAIEAAKAGFYAKMRNLESRLG